MTHGNLDFDFRRRCAVVVRESPYMPEHYIIFYGMDTQDMSSAWPEVIDLPSPYAELSRGGRRPGSDVGTQRHFFNKRIVDGDVHHGKGSNGKGEVRGGADSGAVGARDAGGGVAGAAQLGYPQAGAGSGDRGASAKRDFEEENCPGHIASAEDPKMCDRCGVHIDSLRPEGETL